MKKIVIQTVLLLLVSFSSMSQTASPSFFEFTGKEISISELPIIKGRWFNPLNRASNQFRYENGTLYTWEGGRCGESQRKIVKAFREENVYTLEAGVTKDPIRCNDSVGKFDKVDTATKTGVYHIKANKDSLEILRSGTLELD